MKGEYEYYHFDYEFEHHNSNPNLKIFCAVYLDELKLMTSAGLIKALSKESFYGPISSEVIFENSKIVRKSSVFINPIGTQYIGAVHQHEGQYMQGSYHKSTPHPSLTKTDVFNFKIKDYRFKNALMSRAAPKHKAKDMFYTPF